MITRASAPKELHATAVRGGKGDAWSRLLVGKSPHSQLRAIAVNRLAPGAHLGTVVQKNAEETYYILSGSGLALEGKEWQPVGPGDCYTTRPGEPCALGNNGTDDLVYLAICLEWKSWF